MAELTKEAVEWVFDGEKEKTLFRKPERARKMCEMRLNGATYKQIGETH